MKTTSDGTVMWDLYYWAASERNSQQFYAIEQVESDRFVLAGEAYIEYDDPNWDAYSHKINSGGETQTTDTYGNDEFNDGFLDVGVTDDGDSVYVGVRDGVFNSDTNEYDFNDAWIFHDGGFSDEWSDTVAIDNLNRFDSVSIDNDRVVAVGSSAPEEGSSKRNVLAVEYDLDSNRNWQLAIDKSGYQDLDSVVVNADDTYLGGEQEPIGENNLDGQLLKYSSATSQNTDNKVQLTNVELSQDSINNNSESDRILTFDALNVSSDGEPDNLTVEMPQSVEIVDVTDVAVVNGDYDVTYSNNESVIEFNVDPDRDVDNVDLAFKLDMTLIGNDTATNG